MKAIALGVRNFVNGLGVTGSSALSNYPKFQLLLTSGVLDRRVDFSRTSNATITNSAGAIAYAPHNLLSASEQFDNSAWTKTTTIVTSNSLAAPDGNTTADTLTAGGANSTTLHSYTAISQSYVFSVWLRRKTGTGNIDITADGSTYVTKAITSSWVRYETAIVPTAGTRTPGIRITTNGDEVYAYGAQLEIGTTATTYNSTTVRNLLGFSELFDNAAWTKSNSFVQTNQLIYSQDFSNAAWVVTGTASKASAPTITYAGSNDSIKQEKSITATSTTFTFSIKLSGSGTISLGLSNTVDDVSRTQITLTATPTRYSITKTFNATASSTVRAEIIRLVTDNATSITVAEAQLVQGSVAGNYRRTDAAALPIYYANHNGVVCAEKLVETTANGNHSLSENINLTINSVYTQTYYIKSAGRTKFQLRRGAAAALPTPPTALVFDLATGTYSGSLASGWTNPSISSVGNGWYRVGITVTATASGSDAVGLYLCDDTGNISYTGDGTSGIYIFGAQLSDSASLDTYVLNAAAAPSASAYYGARFDYVPVTLQPKGLLIEEQRANLVLNSTIDGANLATQNVTVTAQAYTLSFYGTGQIVLSGTASATVTGTGAYPTRKTLTFTPTAGTLTLTVTGTVQYAQLEAGSFATSYIPTGASQATRTADVATVNGSNFYSWFGTNEASVTATFDSPASGNRNALSIDDNTANNYLQLRTETADPFFRQKWTGTEQVALDLGTITANTMNKAGYGFKVNDYAAVINGGTVGTDTSASTIIADRMRIGTSQAGEYLNGHVKSVACYSTRNTDATLKGLTA